MNNTYHVWTLQMAKWKLAAESSIELLDTTAKSGIKAFAPAFNDVMNYKDGKLSQEMYTDIYLRRMRESRKNNPKDWKRLEKNCRVAIVCYCRAGEFCHRHLFVNEYKNYLEGLGHTVIVHGELTKKERIDPPHQAEPPRKVYGFHGKEDLLSNWNPRGFTVKGVRFEHGEQFMMYCKAMLMGDKDTAALILAEKDPGECKRLGKLVFPWNEALWVDKRQAIMFRGCLQKAREHKDVADFLLSMPGVVIAEASKFDKIWGVGLGKDDPRLQDLTQWRGLNLLGYAWERVRMALENEVVF